MNGRFAEIDYLRGYSVVTVVAFHFFLFSPTKTIFMQHILQSTDLGVGVDIFFVISGFVIAGALRTLWSVETKTDALSARDIPLVFYRKRFIRLWPAATLWLLLNFALVIYLADRHIWPTPAEMFKKLISGVVYLYNVQELGANGPLGYFWSLSVEWQFYLAMPLILLFVRRDDLRAGVFLAMLAASVIFRPGGDLWWLFRFDGIVIGVLLYMLKSRIGISVPEYKCLQSRYLRAPVNMILLVAAVMAPKFGVDHRLGVVFASMIGAVLVFLASADRGYISTFGLTSVVRWLGSRSYSIYLSHIPSVMVGFLAWEKVQFMLNGWALFVYFSVSVIFTAIFSELSYRFVESPSHKASRAIKLPAPAAPKKFEPALERVLAPKRDEETIA